jgi:hypothetical protein
MAGEKLCDSGYPNKPREKNLVMLIHSPGLKYSRLIHAKLEKMTEMIQK